MKYFYMLISISLLISCAKLNYVEVIIQNQTEQVVQIEAFFDGMQKEIIEIQPNENHIVPQYFHPEDNYIRLFEDELVDSVTIKFNNERIIIQSCEAYQLSSCANVEKNILSFEVNYKFEELARKEFQYTYLITAEDYQRAVPIEK